MLARRYPSAKCSGAGLFVGIRVEVALLMGEVYVGSESSQQESRNFFHFCFGEGRTPCPSPFSSHSRLGSVNEKSVERVEVTRPLRATLTATLEPLATGVCLRRVHDEGKADASLVSCTDRAIGLNPRIGVLGELLEFVHDALCAIRSCVADRCGVCVGLHVRCSPVPDCVTVSCDWSQHATDERYDNRIAMSATNASGLMDILEIFFTLFVKLEFSRVYELFRIFFDFCSQGG